jgi:hypothetical protein
MVFDAGGPLIFNCRYTSILIVVDHVCSGGSEVMGFIGNKMVKL